MVESETLQFENGRALQNLYANDLRLLQTLEEKLGVKVTTRDGWLRLEGERDNINKARQVFDQLEQARQRGMQIQRHEFQYALDSVSDNHHQPLGQLAGVQLLSSNRRAPINPKTGQQLAYVQAIQSRDLVWDWTSRYGEDLFGDGYGGRRVKTGAGEAGHFDSPCRGSR